MVNYLNFEKPLSKIEGKIRELNEVRLQDDNGSISLNEINKLEARAQEVLANLYKNLSTWEKTQVARHPERPHFLDYSKGLANNFIGMTIEILNVSSLVCLSQLKNKSKQTK